MTFVQPEDPEDLRLLSGAKGQNCPLKYKAAPPWNSLIPELNHKISPKGHREQVAKQNKNKYSNLWCDTRECLVLLHENWKQWIDESTKCFCCWAVPPRFYTSLYYSFYLVSSCRRFSWRRLYSRAKETRSGTPPRSLRECRLWLTLKWKKLHFVACIIMCLCVFYRLSTCFMRWPSFVTSTLCHRWRKCQRYEPKTHPTWL